MMDNTSVKIQNTPQSIDAFLKSGDLRGALSHCQEILGSNPRAVQYWAILGAIQMKLGHFSASIEAFRNCVRLVPTSADHYNNLGVAFLKAGKEQEAASAFAAGLRRTPDAVSMQINLGKALLGQGQSAEAADAFRLAVSTDPKNADGWNRLGSVLRELGQLEDAKNAYLRLIEISPNSPEAHYNIGRVFVRQEKYDVAINSYNKALEYAPDMAEIHCNLGVALQAKGDLVAARKAYERSIELEPSMVHAHRNLGMLEHALGDFQGAHLSYDAALRLAPWDALSTEGKAFLALGAGDLIEGFRLFEARLHKKKGATRRPHPSLSWDKLGQLEGKHILTYEEQGLGDTIQFCRYLPLLTEKGAEVTFKVTKKLHELLSSLPANINFVDEWPKEGRFDCEIPLMSLPHRMNTAATSIPCFASYLHANPKRISHWQSRLPPTKFRIGICWQGSTHPVDEGRSFRLEHFSKLASRRDVSLISLHKGAGESQLEHINFHITVPKPELDAGPDAFVDTAAIIMNCDLVITSDTSIAHLAGALGKPTWILLKKFPDWRWMIDRDYSPWYPSVVLYRQNSSDNWSELFDRVSHDLDRTLMNAQIQ